MVFEYTSISSRSAINIEKFRIYCGETFELFAHLYPCFHMQASVHQLLTHGTDMSSLWPYSHWNSFKTTKKYIFSKN